MSKIKDTLLEIQTLEQENCELKARNEFLQRMVNGLRLNNRELTKERNDPIDELTTIKQMGMFEFGSKYCNEEQNAADGKAFAESLIGGK